MTTTAGLCRACGSLLTHHTNGWAPVQPGRTCRYSATTHSTPEPHPRAAQMIAAGRTHVPAGDTLAPA